MRRITWSPAALEDLQAAFHYVLSDSPRRAHEWLERLLGRVERLARFPSMGRRIPELGEKLRYRQIVMGDYRIFYEARDRGIVIFRVLHSRQIFED